MSTFKRKHATVKRERKKQWTVILVVVSVIVAVIAWLTTAYYTSKWPFTDPNSKKKFNIDEMLACPTENICDGPPEVVGGQLQQIKCKIYVPSTSVPFVIPSGMMSYKDLTKTWEPNIQSLDQNIVTVTELPDSIELTPNNVGQFDINLTLSLQITDEFIKTQKCLYSVNVYHEPYFGIDLGTTYSCISYQEPMINDETKRRNTSVVWIDNTASEHCIPSAIFIPNHGPIIIGHEAKKKRKKHSNKERVIFDIKRIIGRRNLDPAVEEFKKKHDFALTEDEEYPKIIIPSRNDQLLFIRPEQALAAILIRLVNVASKQYKFSVPYIRKVVVSTPAIFHDAQRKGVLAACKIAGLDVQQLTPEPSAAAIAYRYHTKFKNTADLDKMYQFFMSFDFGGGTLDCSVLQCTGITCKVLGISGNSSLGGVDFDQVIIAIAKEELKKKNMSVVEFSSMANEISTKAEDIKKTLTSKPFSYMKVVDENGFPHEIKITRQAFESHSLTEEIIRSAIETAKNVVNDKKFKSKNIQMSNIRAIILAGGSSRIPIVEESLKQEFKELEIINPDKDETMEFDTQLMIVAGAGVIGGSLAMMEYGPESSGLTDLDIALPDIEVNDVLPMDIGFEICEGIDNNRKCELMDVVIERYTPYPAKQHKLISICKLPHHTLKLYEGKSRQTNQNYYLSELVLDAVKQSDSCYNVSISLGIDSDGTATFNATVDGETYQSSSKSNDAVMTDEQIEEASNEMLEWFSKKEQVFKLKN